MSKKPTSAVKRRYNDKAYDQVTVFLPKGSKDYIKRQAARRNMSMAKFISASVLHYIGKTGQDLKDLVDDTPAILPQHTIEEILEMQE